MNYRLYIPLQKWEYIEQIDEQFATKHVKVLRKDIARKLDRSVVEEALSISKTGFFALLRQ